MATTSAATTLTLITTQEEEVIRELKPGQSEDHGFGDFTRRIFTGKKKEVSLDDVRGQLDTIQGQLDSLLQGLRDPKEGPFKLSEVEVGLSITAEGSIGIVTVGGEVSVSLKFARTE